MHCSEVKGTMRHPVSGNSTQGLYANEHSCCNFGHIYHILTLVKLRSITLLMCYLYELAQNMILNHPHVNNQIQGP
jgi:hypothetical protein